MDFFTEEERLLWINYFLVLFSRRNCH